MLAYNYMADVLGIASEEAYPYKGVSDYCRADIPHAAKFSNVRANPQLHTPLLMCLIVRSLTCLTCAATVILSGQCECEGMCLYMPRKKKVFVIASSLRLHAWKVIVAEETVSDAKRSGVCVAGCLHSLFGHVTGRQLL